MEELYKKQNGRCQYSWLLLVDLKDSHFVISIEHINTRLPYIQGNICLVINCLNIVDCSGGLDWMKEHSKKLGRLLSFDEDEIKNHSPQGWSYDMVNGVWEQVSSWSWRELSFCSLIKITSLGEWKSFALIYIIIDNMHWRIQYIGCSNFIITWCYYWFLNFYTLSI